MNVRYAISIVCGVVLAWIAFVPVARADEWNQMTKMSFSQPVELPGMVLPAGQYWFTVADSPNNRNVVEVYKGDWSRQLAVLLTIPSYRTQSTDRTEIKFAERPHDRPEALLKWYYPGRLTGREFVYSKRHEREFAHDQSRDLVVRPLKIRG